MEKKQALLTHKIRSIDDKIYDLIQEKKQLQNELDSLGVIIATHDKELDITLIDSDINTWSEEKKVYFELVGKLNEPERSICLNNFDESIFKCHFNDIEHSIENCIYFGIDWNVIPQLSLIRAVFGQLCNNTYQFDKI